MIPIVVFSKKETLFWVRFVRTKVIKLPFTETSREDSKKWRPSKIQSEKSQIQVQISRTVGLQIQKRFIFQIQKSEDPLQRFEVKNPGFPLRNLGSEPKNLKFKLEDLALKSLRAKNDEISTARRRPWWFKGENETDDNTRRKIDMNMKLWWLES